MKINGSEAMQLRAAGLKLTEIAARYGCTKSAVSVYLRRTRTRINRPVQLKPCRCGCGEQTKRKRYASQDCYYRDVARLPYLQWRTGQRMARKLVEPLFHLEDGYIVHHVDRNCANNTLPNLWVFASHADHMSHHRGGSAQPIWRGDQQA